MAFPPNAAKLAAYRSTSVHAGVDAADPHRLVVMLMDGALERIATARGLMKHGGGAEKAQLLHRAVAIIDELRNSLNFKAGGAHRHQPRRAVRIHVPAPHAGECLEQARVARRSQPPAERDPLGLAADCRRRAALRWRTAMSVPASQPAPASAAAAGARLAARRWRRRCRTPAGAAWPPPCSPAPGMSREYLREQRWGRVHEEAERTPRAARLSCAPAARREGRALPARARRRRRSNRNAPSPR